MTILENLQNSREFPLGILGTVDSLKFPGIPGREFPVGWSWIWTNRDRLLGRPACRHSFSKQTWHLLTYLFCFCNLFWNMAFVYVVFLCCFSLLFLFTTCESVSWEWWNFSSAAFFLLTSTILWQCCPTFHSRPFSPRTGLYVDPVSPRSQSLSTWSTDLAYHRMT